MLQSDTTRWPHRFIFSPHHKGGAKVDIESDFEQLVLLSTLLNSVFLLAFS